MPQIPDQLLSFYNCNAKDVYKGVNTIELKII